MGTIKIGNKVRIIDNNKIYTTYSDMFKQMKFKNIVSNPSVKNSTIGTVFAVCNHFLHKERKLFGVNIEGMVDKQVLICSKGLEKISNIEKFEVQSNYIKSKIVDCTMYYYEDNGEVSETPVVEVEDVESIISMVETMAEEHYKSIFLEVLSEIVSENDTYTNAIQRYNELVNKLRKS